MTSKTELSRAEFRKQNIYNKYYNQLTPLHNYNYWPSFIYHVDLRKISNTTARPLTRPDSFFPVKFLGLF